jgi:hypothetical protein
MRMTTTATAKATTTAAAPTASGTRATPAPLSLDDLAGKTVAELTALYQAGTIPASIAALDGTPRCRMLSIVGIDRGPVAAAIRNISASRFFPWAGKSFTSRTAEEGEGINRVRLAGERRWYPFATRVEPSAIDGKPAILLDYDLVQNPFFIRRIRDELREIAPGLFLGPAMADVGSKPSLILYFACDLRAVN